MWPPTTHQADRRFEKTPFAAAFLRGEEVSGSALHATQNTIRLSFSRTETITLLSDIMNDLQSHKALTVKAKAATGSFLCVCSIVCNLSARKLWFKDYSLRRQSVLAAELPNPGARRTWAPYFISVIKTHKNEKATHTSKTLLKGTGTRGRAERCRWQLNLLPINYSAAEYETGVANFFCKRPGSKYFQLCGPLSLCHKHSCSTLLPRAAIYNTYLNERAWLCPNETLFRKTSLEQHVTQPAEVCSP